MTIRIRPVLAAAIALVAALATGCTEEGPAMDPAAELAARPSSQEIVTRYEQMELRIRDQLDAELGPFAWEVKRNGEQGGCGANFPNLGGVTTYLPSWGFDGNIADGDWPRAKQIVTGIIAEYGFTSPTLQIDKPGQHETSAADLALGAQFDLGTKVNTTMQTTTGCHPKDPATPPS
jgi:hypothetical protein